MLQVRKVVSSLAVLAVVGWMAGCAKPPVEQQNAAKAAIDTAQQAGAEEYAADEWQSAQQAMSSAQAEIDAQGKKMALRRSYSKAKELLQQADDAAAKAATAAAANKAKAKDDAQNALTQLNQSIETLKTNLSALEACPHKPKGFQQDYAQLNGKLDGLNTEAGTIQTAIDGESYKDALTKAQSLQAEVDALGTDVQNAKTKLGC